jgi:ComF family protein
MKLPANWQSLFAPVLDVFLKQNCPLCDRVAGNVVCTYCHKQLLGCKFPHPDRDWGGDWPLFIWGKYEGAIERSIAKLKYENHRDLAILLGELLAIGWQETSPKIHAQTRIIPIPLHPNKLKQRGFNQAESIARQFCKFTGLKLDLSLQRDRDTMPQFSLSKQQRLDNVANAFSLAANTTLKSGDRVILLDDIYTTGSTAKSAAQALTDRGITVLGVIAVATTNR